MAPNTIPSSGLWRELTIGTGRSEKQRCNIKETSFLKVLLLVRSDMNTKLEG